MRAAIQLKRGRADAVADSEDASVANGGIRRAERERTGVVVNSTAAITVGVVFKVGVGLGSWGANAVKALRVVCL